MKTLISILLIIIPLLCPFAQAQNQESSNDEWYPFYFPEKLDQNSPMNIGNLVLDAPAGKHGFCKVKDGHFYFEDGTRAKFWGTNLCFNACFPTKEQAEMLATRIAYFGFNAVRLHHMDFFFEPKGIFEDICPAYKDPQMKKTSVLSKKQLDKLDYLIYQLKIRGIYIDMNLLVSRHFTEADGVKFGNELGMAAKPVSMFDPTLIALQKQYAKDLLTHFNPYTKLRYCEDPTIALIEITNENSILASWHNNELNGAFFGLKKRSIPDLYVKQLDNRWNAWLQNKYGNIENLKLAWNNEQQPTIINNQPLATDKSPWAIEQHTEAKGTFSSTSEGFVIEATAIAPTSWHLQFRINPISLIKNQTYTFKFSAKAKTSTPLSLVCQQAAPPYANLGFSESVDLTEEWQNFEISFKAAQSCENTKLAFIFGHTQNQIWIKNINLSASDNFDTKEVQKAIGFAFQRPLYKLRSFYSPQKLKDCRDFYIDLEKLYFREIIKILRDTLGTKVPITGIGGFWAPEDMDAMQECDFLDKHAYWDHPQFPNKPWDKSDFKIHNRSILNDSNLGIIGPLVIANRKAQHESTPFTVTEWNHCYPNQFAYETPLLLSTIACQNNWDALFQFAFSHGWNNNPEFDSIQNYFDTLPNAQQLVLSGLGSYIFLKNTDIVYNIKNNIFEFETKLISGVCGQIKNIQLTLDKSPISVSEDGAIVLLKRSNQLNDETPKLALFMISKIKNKNSEWENNRFTWGTKPTQLKILRTDEQFRQTIETYPDCYPK